MTTAISTTITITASAFGIIIMALLMMGTAFEGNLKDKVYRMYFFLLVFNLVGSCVELLLSALLFNTSEGLDAVPVRILSGASYLLGNIVIVIFVKYVYEYLAVKSTVSKKPLFLITGLIGVNCLLIVLMHFTKIYDWLVIQNDFVQEAQLFVNIIPVLSAAILMAYILRNRQLLKSRELVSMLLYIVIPYLAYAIEYMYPGVLVSYPGVAISLFMVYLNIQVELRRTLNERDAELTNSRIAIMLSQIQPHFLYNSLTAIAALCDVAPGKVKPAVQSFAHYLRGNLDSLKEQKLIPFIDELGHVETYLALEKLRYGDSLQVQYDIAMDDFMLPPLTVQPIVENAVQHGVMEKDGGGTVRVSAERVKDAVRITVSDDGVGFDPAGRSENGQSHIGIDNVRSRLSSQCGGTLIIDSVPGAGTTAVITIPYIAERGVFQ